MVGSARIAKFLVSETPFYNFIETVLQILTPIYKESEEIEGRTLSHFEALVLV